MKPREKSLARRIARHWPSLAVYVVSLAAIVALFAIYDNIVGTVRSGRITNALLMLSDAVLIMAPLWLLSNRWKWTAVAPTAFISIFLYINALYFRFWGEVLPLSALSMTGNINGLLIDSAFGLMQPSDTLLFLPLIVQAALMAGLRRKLKAEPRVRPAMRWTAAALSALFFMATQMWCIEKRRVWHRILYSEELSFVEAMNYRYSFDANDPLHFYADNGITVLAVKMVEQSAKVSRLIRQLGDDERTRVDSFIAGRHPHTPVVADTASRNVVFIIVESFNSAVVNHRVGGHEITPVINRLLQSDSTLYSLEMRSQVCDGASGDGHLIYNAGVLPLTDAATPMSVVPRITFNPLSAQLRPGYSLSAVFADDGKSWHQVQAFNKYGFDNIYTCDNFGGRQRVRGYDGAMFDFALDVVKDLPEPFFVELVTISMHVPFQDPGVEGFDHLRDDSLTQLENDYHRMAAYFDHELGVFIDSLKRLGLYDNTILIIASDHSQNYNGGDIHAPDDKSLSTVFIAANSPAAGRVEKPVGQIDVFPTILDLVGTKPEPYMGLGRSMLDSADNSVDSLAEIQAVSELMLKGDYFGI